MATFKLLPQLRTMGQRFVESVALGAAREIAYVGARGDGKTIAAAWATVLHATTHYARGYPWPTEWLVAASTHKSHEMKLIPSLREPHWEGRWHIRGDMSRATYRLDGHDLVILHLFGTSDEAGGERLRAASHGLWFEEVSPTLELGGRALTREQWELGMTSIRRASHANVGMLTTNPGTGEEDDWVYGRFLDDPAPGRLCYQAPPGEWATVEQREAWAQSITDPLLRRRLLDGQPAALLPGRPVAYGYVEALHLSKTPLRPMPHGEIWLGQDGGLMPATVIAQRAGGRVQVLASLWSEHSAIRQHWSQVVIPWLGEHAPWALDYGCTVMYDPTLNTGAQGDMEANAVLVMGQVMPRARLRAGVNTPWAARRDPLLSILARQDEGRGLLILDPVQARSLHKALMGRWHYAVTLQGGVRKEEPHKPDPPWADLGDALCYLLQGMHPLAPPRAGARGPSKIGFSPFDLRPRPERTPSKVDFRVFGDRQW